LAIVFGLRLGISYIFAVVLAVNVALTLFTLTFELCRLELMILTLGVVLLECKSSLTYGSMTGLSSGHRTSIRDHHRLLFRYKVLFEEKLLVIGFVLLKDIIEVHLIGLADT
jgi:hypothetical protein